MRTVTVDDLPMAVGQELGASAWRKLDQPTVDAFADVTDDRQWMHVDVDRARGEDVMGSA